MVANDNELVKTLLPPNINIALEASSSTYSVGLTITATGVDEIPISYQFFYQLLTNYLDRVRDRRLWCGLTVGEFLDAIKWNPQDDIDAVLLKLIAAKVEDTKFEKVKSCKKLEGLEDIVILKSLPPLYHILKAQVELVRHQNDDLLKTLKRKLKNAIETLKGYGKSSVCVLMNAEEESIDLKLYMFSPEALDFVWVPLGIDLSKLRKFKELVKAFVQPCQQ